MKRLFHLFILLTLLFFSLYIFVGILINSITVDIMLGLLFVMLSAYLLILTVDYIYKFVLYLKRKRTQDKKENKEQVNQVRIRAVVQDKDRLFKYNLEINDSTLLSCLNKLSSYCEQQEFRVIKLDII